MTERLDEAIHQLSQLASLTLVIPCDGGIMTWEHHERPGSPVQRTRWATRVLESIRGTQLKDVWVQFKLRTIASLGQALSCVDSTAPVEACQALEASLLAFPQTAWNIQFHWHAASWRRAQRPEFWSPSIAGAFPKLNARGLLTLLHSKSNILLVSPYHRRLTEF